MQDKRLIRIFKYFLLFICSSVSTIANTHPNFDLKEVTIVLDAGHGGKDIGSAGSILIEKDMTLILAKELGAKLEELDSQINILYTRDGDQFLPLHERVNIANENNAHLFISIHCNAISNTNPSGIESYVLGPGNNKEDHETVKRENRSILHETNYKDFYNGFDPDSPSGNIIMSTVQNVFLKESITLAHKIQSHFDTKVNLKNRGVKQAGFVVLRRATMPAILLEAGFLSNKNDERILMTHEARARIVQAMASGIVKYVEENIDLNSSSTVAQSETSTLISTVENVFQILIASSVKGSIESLSGNTILGNNVVESVEQDIHQYFIGSFSDLATAITFQNQLRTEGYAGAYVVKRSIKRLTKSVSNNRLGSQ